MTSSWSQWIPLALFLVAPRAVVAGGAEEPAFAGWTMAEQLSIAAEQLEASGPLPEIASLRIALEEQWLDAGFSSDRVAGRDERGEKARLRGVLNGIHGRFMEGACVGIETDAWMLPGNGPHRVIALLYGARCAVARGDGEEAAAYMSMAAGALVVLDRKALARRLGLAHRVSMLNAGKAENVFSDDEARVREAVGRGLDAWASGDLSGAKVAFNGAASRYPVEWIRLACLGRIHLEEGRLPEADEVCRRLVDSLGGESAIKDEPARALEARWRQRSTETRDDRHRAQLAFADGVSRLDAGDLDAAEEYFLRATASVPGFGPALLGLCQVDMGKGKRASAAVHLRRAQATFSRVGPGELSFTERMVSAWAQVTRPEVHPGLELVDATGAAGLGMSAESLMPDGYSLGTPGAFDVPSTGGKHVGSGAAFLDFDLDGDLDLFVLNPSLFRHGAAGRFPPLLYENDGAGKFEDVAERAGLSGVAGGYGVAVADYDGDGDPDLYITRAGPNLLFRNDGGGRFEDVSAGAGVADGGFGVGAAWLDYDADGHLDLYVVNFMDLDGPVAPEMARGSHGRGEGGELFRVPEANVLYRNLGSGVFEEVTTGAGARLDDAWTWAVTVADFDDDGRPDCFAANDRSRDALLKNNGDGTFFPVGRALGLGDPRAGMGAVAADLDRDLDLDLAVSYHWAEPLGIFYNRGPDGFRDRSRSTGIAGATMGRTSWGVEAVDLDNDGWLDLYVANGPVARADRVAVSPNGPLGSLVARGQADQVFRNESGRRWVSTALGMGALRTSVSRGIATGDYDDDGRMDLFVTHVHEGGALLRNVSENSNGWLKLRLLGTPPNRDALGARIYVYADDEAWMSENSGARGFLGAHAPELQVGLGAATRVDSLVVHWPNGEQHRFRDLAPNERYVVKESTGELEIRARYGRP